MFVSGFSTGFVRLKFFGKDRARFLHNFCTNNVKALSPGSACEAFFADVKAKTLAHGYVLAFEDSHEIWMLPGDPDALEKHLNRYLITEDVKIERVSGVTSVFPNSAELQAAFQTKIVPTESGSFQCFTATSADPAFAELTEGISGLVFSWAGCSLVAIGGSQSDSAILIHTLAGRQLQPLSCEALERLRIDERFPVTGRDMTGDNLAPEAERNAVAISYSKGCYLGQEPIARLDAMGHVNRALRIIKVTGTKDASMLIGSSLATADGTVAGVLTSAVHQPDGGVRGLAMIRLNVAMQVNSCVTPNGTKYDAAVVPL